MTKRGTSLATLLLTWFAFAAAAPAHAQYSMAGKWGVEPSSFGLWLDQAGGTLSNHGGSAVGTINEATGEFHLNLGPLGFPLCGHLLLDGDVALDSLTFDATVTYGTIVGPTPGLFECETVQVPSVGSRCGNDELDPGEECDDSNGRDGDCCSSTCAYDTAGASCTSDNDQCTDDTCDGSGTCNHVENTAPCTVGCMAGACTAGDCVTNGPAPAGLPCDADYDNCTVADACDGAGLCAPGPEMDCSPCGVCESSLGCITDYACTLPSRNMSLAMEIAGDSADDGLTMKLRGEIDPAEFGNPLTDTNYTLCLSAADGSFLQVVRPVLSFSLPIGGTCGTRDCWRSAGSGFRYKDKGAANDGITSLAASRSGFTVKGRGTALPYGATLPPDGGELAAQIVVDDGTTRRCWGTFLTATSESDTSYKGGYRP